VLIGDIKTRLEALFKECCEINGWIIHELNIQKDHVHLLLQTKPSDSIATVMQYLKGGSSKVIRSEFPELEEFLWGDSFWCDGYFAESYGSKNEDMIRKYVQNQNKS
jgi:putative transposase